MRDLLITEINKLTAKEINVEMVSVWNNAKLTIGNTNGEQGKEFPFKQIVVRKSQGMYSLAVKHYTNGKIMARYKVPTIAKVKAKIKEICE